MAKVGLFLSAIETGPKNKVIIERLLFLAHLLALQFFVDLPHLYLVLEISALSLTIDLTIVSAKSISGDIVVSFYRCSL